MEFAQATIQETIGSHGTHNDINFFVRTILARLLLRSNLELDEVVCVYQCTFINILSLEQIGNVMEAHPSHFISNEVQ